MSAAGGQGRIIALCGGVGGAKLALGLSRLVSGDRLSIIVNTGDDFDHFGWRICPDLDTVTYTLADIVNTQTGWGRANESWNFMTELRALGGEDWFQLGDRDLAVHALRTARLAAGERLTEVTAGIARRLGIAASILPMTDAPVRTMVDTTEGLLAFQHYFVRRRCEPAVRSIRIVGAADAEPTPEIVATLSAPDLAAILVCPSNPYLSIDPILAIPGMRQAIQAAAVPVIAVSPIVGGTAIKGPLAKMMAELGLRIEPQTVIDHYEGLIDILVADEADRGSAMTGPEIHFTNTIMKDIEDRVALAREVLALAERTRRGKCS